LVFIFFAVSILVNHISIQWVLVAFFWGGSKEDGGMKVTIFI